MAVLLSSVMGSGPSLADAAAGSAAAMYVCRCGPSRPPLRARGNFQRLVGNCAGEDFFVSLVEVGIGLLVHG